RLVDRDAEAAVRRAKRVGKQARLRAPDVEISHLGEPEDLLVEIRPALHLALRDVVREMVDPQEPLVRPQLRPIQRDEVGVVDASARPEAIDEVDETLADAVNRRVRQIRLARLRRARAAAYGFTMRRWRIVDAPA